MNRTRILKAIAVVAPVLVLFYLLAVYMQASRNRHFAAATARNDLPSMAALLRRGADIEEAEADKLLVLAAACGCFPLVKVLLERGSYAAGDNRIQTAFLAAAREGWGQLYLGACGQTQGGGREYAKIVAMLLEKRPELEARDRYGDTPLLAAAKCGNVLTVQHLLRAGADINANDRKGMTALAAAIYVFPLTRELLRRGADVNAAGRGDTPLIAAARMGCWQMVDILVRRGADINKKRSDGLTPLMTATPYQALHGYGCIARLVANGADLEARDNQGRTALERSVDSKEELSVLALLDAGAQLRGARRSRAMALARQSKERTLMDKLKQLGVRG